MTHKLPGRPGYTTTVITPWGRETYQVLLEEKPPLWVARIVTLPNKIWAKPGGQEALKFSGPTAEEAEAAAASFLEEERILNKRRIWTPTGQTVSGRASVGTWPSAKPPQPQPLQPPTQLKPPTSPAAPRIERRLLLRFGIQSPPALPAITANLSASGMFVITDRPAPVGSLVTVDLRFPEIPLLLGGEVVWVRERREQGSLGFGMKITRKPPEYVSRLHSLQAAAPPGPPALR